MLCIVLLPEYIAMNLFSLLSQLASLEFWESLFAAYSMSGAATALLLPMLESFIPALPLIAIAALNTAAFGYFRGFLYTWIGSCIGNTLVFLFYRHVLRHAADYLNRNGSRIQKARQAISDFDPLALFLLICIPFTPSSFINFAFGLSDFSQKRYLTTMLAAKITMIGSLVFFGQSITQAEEHPLQLILGLVMMGLLYLLSVKLRKKYHLEDK